MASRGEFNPFSGMRVLSSELMETLISIGFPNLNILRVLLKILGFFVPGVCYSVSNPITRPSTHSRYLIVLMAVHPVRVTIIVPISVRSLPHRFAFLRAFQAAPHPSLCSPICNSRGHTIISIISLLILDTPPRHPSKSTLHLQQASPNNFGRLSF